MKTLPQEQETHQVDMDHREVDDSNYQQESYYQQQSAETLQGEIGEPDEHAEILHTIKYEQKQVWVNILTLLAFMIFIGVISIGILLPFIVLVPLYYPYFMYIFKRRRCYITGHNIVLKEDIPFLICCLPTKTEKHIQLQNIVDVTVSQNFVQRYFDCWTIHIQNPGQGSVDGTTSDLIIYGCKNPVQVKRLVLDLSQKLKSGGADSTGSIPSRNYGAAHAPFPKEVGDAIVDIRDSLKRLESHFTQNGSATLLPS